MPRPPRALVLIWLATALVLGAALGGDYVDDDLDLLGASPAFAGIGHLGEAVRMPFWGYELSYWRPLTSAVMCIGHWLGGGHPWPTHLAALLAHLLATTLVFAILRRLGVQGTFAALAAALFALHPCQVESVAWVAAVGDPLSGAATLLALFGWIAWRERAGAGLPRLAWLGLALALASKESGVMTLGWLLAADVALRRRWPLPRGRWLLGWAGMAVVVAAWLGLRMLVFGDLAAGFDRGQLTLDLHGTDSVALRAYLGSSFVALPSGWLGITPYRWIPPTGAGLWAALPLRALAVLGAGIALVGAAQRQRELAWLGGLGFAFAIAPAVLAPASLGPWPLVDRYVYVAMFGVAAVLLGSGATRAWLGSVLVAVCAVCSAVAVPQWRSHDAVLARALADCPQHPEPHFMAGNAERLTAERPRPGRDQAADVGRHLHAAVAAYARARARLQQPLYASAHLQRVLGPSIEVGTAMAQLQGQMRPAVAVYRQLDTTADQFPQDANVQIARGIAAAMAGNAAGAEVAWLRALELQPGNDQAAFNLGRLYLEHGRRDEARARFEQALQLQPGNEAARAYLQRLAR
jgi:protein O-mannosyl-transferase